MTQHPGEVAHQNKKEDISEDAVVDYLRRHPEFFRVHSDILNDMEVPNRSSGDGIVDMQHFLLDRRASEVDELRDCAQEVIETSRSNMSVQSRTHAAILAILPATDLHHLARILTDDWPYLLDVDVVTIGFEPPHLPDPRFTSQELVSFPAGTADRIIGIGGDIGVFKALDDDGTLFGAGAGLVKSAAIARIRPSEYSPTGILALGSRGDVFHPGQGTELVNFLVRVVEKLVRKAEDSPPGQPPGQAG